MEVKFNETELLVIKNFAQITPSMRINPDVLVVRSVSNTCVAKYKFETAYEFPTFGLYETPELLAILSVYKTPTIKVIQDSHIEIVEGSSKTKYFTTPLHLIQEIPDVSGRFDSLSHDMEFVLSQEKLSFLQKMTSVLRADFIFFETEGDKIRITIGEELDNSKNTWNVVIEEEIKANNLPKILKASLADFKLIPADYNVKISKDGISKWTNGLGVEYYIGLKAA